MMEEILVGIMILSHMMIVALFVQMKIVMQVYIFNPQRDENNASLSSCLLSTSN